jgi:hypothetical protein
MQSGAAKLLGDLRVARTAYGLLQEQSLVKVNPLDEPHQHDHQHDVV